MKKTGDSEARKAAKTLRKYCNKHEYCNGCIFNMKKTTGNCLLVNKLPFDWVRY